MYFIYSYLKAKIDKYRQEHHVVDLIHIFRDILFHPNNEPRLFFYIYNAMLYQ